jgi:hypothetical protein
MKVGGVGCLLTMVSLLMMNAFFFMPRAIPTPDWVSIVSITTAAIAMMGIVLIFIGTLGLWTQYESSISLMSGIVGLIAAIIWFVGVILEGAFFYGYGYEARYLGLGIAAVELLGAFWIFLGAVFLLLRNETGQYGFTMAAGIMMMIVGTLLCSIIWATATLIWALLLPTLICAMIVFFKGK